MAEKESDVVALQHQAKTDEFSTDFAAEKEFKRYVNRKNDIWPKTDNSSLEILPDYLTVELEEQL